MPSIDATSKKRKRGHEVPDLDTTRPKGLDNHVTQQVVEARTEKTIDLLSSIYLDVTIKCQGREFKACGAIMAARCEFFHNRLNDKSKGSRTWVIKMNKDDPDALEAFIEYLHTSTIVHIQDWNTSYEHRSVLKYGWMDRDTFTRQIMQHRQTGELPRGYLPLLANILVVANKYGNQALANAVASMFESEGRKKCPLTERERELRKAYSVEPADVFKAASILSRLPSACTERRLAEASLLRGFGYNCLDWAYEPSDLTENHRRFLGGELAANPVIFFTLADHFRNIVQEQKNLSKRVVALGKENALLRQRADVAGWTNVQATAAGNGQTYRENAVWT